MTRPIAVLVALALLAGCNPPPESATPTVERTFESEGVTLTLRLDKDRLNMAESLEVRVEAIIGEDQQLEFPERIGSPEDFRVASTRTEPPRLLDDGRVAVEQVYELEPYAPGEWTIPPIEIETWNAADPGNRRTAATEAITVTVDSVLTVDAAEAELQDIRDPLAAPWPWEWILAGIGLLALIGWLLWRRYRNKKAEGPPPEPPTPPYEIAVQRLEQLLASDLLDREAYKEFYLELTALLRRYIEDEFGLKAPERTTEEFLAEMRRSLAFNPEQRELLRQFLVHGDMVKFAELKPTRDEALRMAEVCRRFLDETRPPAKPPSGEAPTAGPGKRP